MLMIVRVHIINSELIIVYELKDNTNKKQNKDKNKSENVFFRKCCLCPLRRYSVNSIFLGGVFPEFLFNEFLRVMCV
jgi:hypothetical protein